MNFKFPVSVLGATLIALATAGAASAQTEDKSLRRVMSFDLLVEQLDEDSATCGITESKVANAVKSSSRGAPFDLRGNEYTLYIRITTVTLENKCFSNIFMEAYYYGELILPNYPKGNYAEVLLWENGLSYVSTTSDHGGDTTDYLKDLTRTFVTDWRGDNS